MGFPSVDFASFIARASADAAISRWFCIASFSARPEQSSFTSASVSASSQIIGKRKGAGGHFKSSHPN
jgi:hypothetical protein